MDAKRTQWLWPVRTFAIPGYALAKLLGIKHGRSRPSLAEMASAYLAFGRN